MRLKESKILEPLSKNMINSFRITMKMLGATTKMHVCVWHWSAVLGLFKIYNGPKQIFDQQFTKN